MVEMKDVLRSQKKKEILLIGFDAEISQKGCTSG